MEVSKMGLRRRRASDLRALSKVWSWRCRCAMSMSYLSSSISMNRKAKVVETCKRPFVCSGAGLLSLPMSFSVC